MPPPLRSQVAESVMSDEMTLLLRRMPPEDPSYDARVLRVTVENLQNIADLEREMAVGPPGRRGSNMTAHWTNGCLHSVFVPVRHYGKKYVKHGTYLVLVNGERSFRNYAHVDDILEDWGVVA